MIERIVDWSGTHRKTVLAIYLVIAVIGAWSISTTPLDALPDLSENQVIVFTDYMGRSPQVVEDQVTFPLVSALQGMPSVKAVRATSMFGMSFIYVIFDEGTETYWARTRVLEKLSSIESQLPTGAKTRLGPDGTGIGHVFWYTLESEEHDPGELRAVQDWFIKPQLQSVEGVAEIASVGGFVREYQVNLDPRRMQSYGITAQQVSGALQSANMAVGGRIVELNDREHFVRGQGYYTSSAQISSTMLRGNGGLPIALREVADVTIGALPRRGSLEKNGTGEATGGIVVMREGENAKAVIDRVKAKIAQIAPGLPKGIKLVPAYDRSELIQASVSNLVETLIEEAIIVTIIVMIFLFHLPSALRIVIEIPISVLIAFILMRIVGITSNIMSLGGIAIGIGVLVDASIVMLENAHRHLSEAEDMLQKNGTPFDFYTVIIRSTKQVARPIFFSILIIIISFLPVFLLTGQEGKLFHPLAFTKTFSLLGSAIVAITLVPVLMTLLMKGQKFHGEDKNPMSRFFMRIYRPVLVWCLTHRKTTLIVNGLALLVSIPIALGLGSEFMPPLDEGSLLFMPTLLPSISLSSATSLIQTQDSIIKAYPEVRSVLGKVGRAETPTDPAPVSMFESIIELKPHGEWRAGITKEKIIADLNERLRMPGVALGWTQPIINRINMLTTGVRTDLGIKIFGPNLDTLERLATEVEALLKPIQGAADVVAERSQAGAYLDIVPKHDAELRYGITEAEINNVIDGAVGGIDAGTFVDGRMRFPITVRYKQQYRSNVEALQRLPVPVSIQARSNSRSLVSTPIGSASAPMDAPAASSSGMSDGMSSGPSTQSIPSISSSIPSPSSTRSLLTPAEASSTRTIPLGELATISISQGPPMIASENALPRSLVFVNVRGRDMGSFVEEAQKTLAANFHLPAGYTIGWSGSFEQQQHAKERLMIMVPLGFILVFLLLRLTLRDWKEAGTVMLSVPFALIGGVYLVAILGMNWSVAVWVGFIALYGVATETGVVMVVYLHEALDQKLLLVEKGLHPPLEEKDIREAATNGAVLRLRPKLMTVFTAMLGLVPIFFSSKVGSDVMRPIAAPMVGGMLTSAIHVLLVTPVIFEMMKLRALKKGTLAKSRMASFLGA